MDISNLEKWHFEMTEKAANYLLGLVLEGKKRATSSSFLGYETEGEPIPKVGERSVCLATNAGVKFTPTEFEAMRILDKDGEDLKTQKQMISFLSLVVLHANELAYAVEKEKQKTR